MMAEDYIDTKKKEVKSPQKLMKGYYKINSEAKEVTGEPFDI